MLSLLETIDSINFAPIAFALSAFILLLAFVLVWSQRDRAMHLRGAEFSDRQVEEDTYEIADLPHGSNYFRVNHAVVNDFEESIHKG